MNPHGSAANEQPTLLHNHARYDGDGKRVEKSNGTLYWYGMSGGVLEETNLTGSWQRDYVFFGGVRISAYTPDGAILCWFDDRLGSTSKLEEISSAGSASLAYDADYYPFGRIHSFVDSYEPSFRFEGKEHDFETGLDNFGARYNDSTIGRFISADWSAVPQAVPYANLTNPQTLNLYAMVSDDPETFADLNGHVQDEQQPTDPYTGAPNSACGGAQPGDDTAVMCLQNMKTMYLNETQEKTAANEAANDTTQQGAAPPPADSQKKDQAQQQNLAGTIYNETGSLRPEVGNNGKTDPASATSLSDAREAVGEVVLNREAAGKTGGVAPSAVSKLGKATSQYADSLAAAKAAIAVGGSKTGPQHYYFRSGGLTIVKGKVTAGDQPSWGRGVVPSASYGPFRNPVKAGDVAAGGSIYVDIYHVP